MRHFGVLLIFKLRNELKSHLGFFVFDQLSLGALSNHVFSTGSRSTDARLCCLRARGERSQSPALGSARSGPVDALLGMADY